MPAKRVAYIFLTTLLFAGCVGTAELALQYPAAPRSCIDGFKNGTETDVDCGGSCPRCGLGKTCRSDGDCNSLNCVAQSCAIAASPSGPSCADGIKNGSETDVDCGGLCLECPLNKICDSAADCTSHSCLGAVCVAAPPSCADGVRNGDESDVDCGGSCGPCALNKTCHTLADCASRVCTSNQCAQPPPSCQDEIKNGNESDIDCGGMCTGCDEGKTCHQTLDCASNNCSGNYCGGTAPPGIVRDLAWPAASNVGHDGTEGDTFHFHWSGSNNVLQVATFEGQVAPTGQYSDASWPFEIRSGGKQSNGFFDWRVGSFPAGYRPGIYFFVDQDNPAGGIVSATVTIPEHGNSHYVPKPCSALSNSSIYGGRYSQFASRPGCTVYEVNNFQTAAHFDWVQPNFNAKQGDLVLFRWTGIHNVVQVHDVTQDAPLSGGINSGSKTNCVGGPAYSCANGPPTLGEFLVDTANYRPGNIHISDECAMTCTGHTTGMNMEYDLRFPVPANTHVPPVPGSCCAINKAKGTACRVVEIYNANDGAQFDYNVPVGRGDLVRFRWAGKLQIYQSTPNSNGSPSRNAKSGGIAMPSAVECIPGPNMGCLQGTTSAAQLMFDVDQEIRRGNAETDSNGQNFFDFYGLGENTSGFTSADTGTLLYVDANIPYNPNPTPCP